MFFVVVVIVVVFLFTFVVSIVFFLVALIAISLEIELLATLARRVKFFVADETHLAMIMITFLIFDCAFD
jgi:hypothetical protein